MSSVKMVIHPKLIFSLVMSHPIPSVKPMLVTSSKKIAPYKPTPAPHPISDVKPILMISSKKVTLCKPIPVLIMSHPVPGVKSVQVVISSEKIAHSKETNASFYFPFVYFC